MGDIPGAARIAKWMTHQRSAFGGYGSTQVSWTSCCGSKECNALLNHIKKAQIVNTFKKKLKMVSIPTSLGQRIFYFHLEPFQTLGQFWFCANVKELLIIDFSD